MSSHVDAAQAAQEARMAREALDRVVADWNRAGAAWDAASLATVYCEDGLLFGGRPGHFVGREAIRSYFASYDGVILAGAMRMNEAVARRLADGCVLAQGMMDFDFALAGNERTRVLLRATLALRLEPAGWRILDHHFSAVPEAPPLGRG